MNANHTSTTTKRRRHRRKLLASILAVLFISLGSLSAVVAAKWTPRLGLDLAGGLSVVYQAEHHVSASDLAETADILNNRVNGLGVSGAQVETTGNNEITVAIPGLKDPAEVLKAIGQTARISFRPVLCYAPPYLPAKSIQSRNATGAAPGPLPASCPASYQLISSNVTGSSTSERGVYYDVGPDPALAAYPTSSSNAPHAVVLQKGLAGSAFRGRYLEGPAELSGTAVKTASAQLSPTGQWVVDIALTGSGSNGWNQMTQRYFHEIIGIELDGVVQSAPITQPTQGTWSSFGGHVEISGDFTQQSAQSLAIALQYGSLPVGLKQLTSQTVSPTLGKSALRAGLGAGIAGLALVLLYVLAYYRALGSGGDLGLGDHGGLSVGRHLVAGSHLGCPELRSGRYHRLDRLDRHHRRLVHRLLRTSQGRDQVRTNREDLGGARLQERLGHGMGGRLRLPLGRSRALRRGRRRREGFCLLPGALDHLGHGRHMVLHEATRDPARTESFRQTRWPAWDRQRTWWPDATPQPGGRNMITKRPRKEK